MNEVSKEYKPITPMGYIGYLFLYEIPIIGLIFAIIHSSSKANINRKNLATATLYCYLIGAIMLIIMFFVLGNIIKTL